MIHLHCLQWTEPTEIVDVCHRFRRRSTARRFLLPVINIGGWKPQNEFVTLILSVTLICHLFQKVFCWVRTCNSSAGYNSSTIEPHGWKLFDARFFSMQNGAKEGNRRSVNHTTAINHKNHKIHCNQFSTLESSLSLAEHKFKNQKVD